MSRFNKRNKIFSHIDSGNIFFDNENSWERCSRGTSLKGIPYIEINVSFNKKTTKKRENRIVDLTNIYDLKKPRTKGQREAD